MKRLLVMTILEYRERPNNRIQHTVNALESEFDEVWLICRARPDSGGIMARLRNILPLPTRVYREGKLRIIEYNPPLNYVEGYSASDSDEGNLTWLKSVINFLGLIREFFFIVTIGYVSLRYLRGSFYVCVVETFWEGIVAISLRRFRKVSFCVFDDNDFNPGYMSNSVRRRYETWMDGWCIRSSDLAVSVGYLLAAFWKEKTGRDLLVIPNGVDTELFKPGSGREKGDVTRLLYVGTLSMRWLDMGLVLDSIKLLIEEGANLALTVIGSGRRDYLDALDNEIRRRDLVDQIEFLGEVDHDELPSIMNTCDIGLAISPGNLLRRFAFPLKVLEYMAMGLPVIGNKGTETEWILEHYQAGVAVNPVQEELCAALRLLLEDRRYYTKCRTNAIAAVGDFDLEKLASLRRKEMVGRFTTRVNS
jgi:glycosyltransferase involved in cell wall biosynthesis